MLSSEHYDAILIGSGQGGNPLAAALAGAKMRTALIERAYPGGTCINYGCTPTKTMVASARVAYVAKRAGEFGISTGGVSVDLPKIRDRKREMVAEFRAGTERRIAKAEGLQLIHGDARFSGPKTVEVTLNAGGYKTLTADRIFIDTGTSHALPQIQGLSDVPWLDNVSIMELDSLPQHLVVLGGGYIGLEFAQMFRRFGSSVTIVNQGNRLLKNEDDDVSEEVLHILLEDDLTVIGGFKTESIVKLGSGIQLKTSDLSIYGSHLLVATGRTPNTASLNLEAAGVTMDEQGYIQVNDRLETSAPGIWALGDVKGGPAFTHISYDDYRVVRANVIDGKDASIKGRMVPYTVYIDPQLGRIGMTEKQARETGRKIQVAKMPMTYVARAIEIGETRGFLKAVVDAETEQILGAAALGAEGGEIASMLQIAMMGKLPYTALRDGVFTHPAFAEALNNLFGHLN